MYQQGKLGNVEKCFPEANEVNKCLITTVHKRVNIFKMKEKKGTKVLISPQKMNIPSLYHIFMKTLYLMWKLWKKG